MEAKLQKLREIAPVFFQPRHDIDLGHSLVKVFVKFHTDDLSKEELCEMIVVYEGEASFSRLKPVKMNRIATLFYMSFNRIVFGRTADLNYLTVTGLNLDGRENNIPWKSIRTPDHCGNQTWSQGNKGNIFNWLSLFYHYKRDLPFSEWEKESGSSFRPKIYINTANHMMGERNRNPQLELYKWDDYPLEIGGLLEAESFARKKIRQKPVLWAPCP